MTKLIADQALRTKLNGCAEPVEVCDEAGQTLGLFLPVDAYRKLFYGRLAAESPYSASELERMHQETGGRTLAELWQELGVS